MNATITKCQGKAFTLIELLVVIAIIIVVGIYSLPMLSDRDRKSTQVLCMNNLKQIGLGFLMYSDDNRKFSWQESTNNGGTQELIPSGDAAVHFAKLTPYLRQPRIFVCPADKGRKEAATNFIGFSNANLSYFVALDVITNNANSILAGDRHLAFNKQSVGAGLFSITNDAAMGWTKEIHYINYIKDSQGSPQTLGVLQFADGHSQPVETYKLPSTLQKQALVTNRLLIP